MSEEDLPLEQRLIGGIVRAASEKGYFYNIISMWENGRCIDIDINKKETDKDGDYGKPIFSIVIRNNENYSVDDQIKVSGILHGQWDTCQKFLEKVEQYSKTKINNTILKNKLRPEYQSLNC